VPGAATIKITIEPSGSVSRAQVNETSKLAKTPSAACLEEVVRAAKFVPFDGSPRTINYPVVLQ
jgi:hypothetical protein